MKRKNHPFYVGQKVRCINDNPTVCTMPGLVLNGIYTIWGIGYEDGEQVGLFLKEIEVDLRFTNGSFDSRRFVPVENDWVDQVLTKALKPLNKASRRKK